MAIVSIKWAGLKDPNKQPSFQDATGAAPVVPTLTFSNATTTSYVAAITGYDAQFTYTISASVGTATRTDGNVTVSGLTANQSSTLTVTAANSARDISFTSSAAFLSLPATPIIVQSTANIAGGTATITNYDSAVTYTISITAGSASRTGNTITVTGLSPGQSVTLSIFANNSSGSTPTTNLTFTADLLGDFESIATIVVPSGGLSDAIFNNIPQTYQHIQMRITTPHSIQDCVFDLQFNGVTSGYTNHVIWGNGTSAGASAEVSQTSFRFGYDNNSTRDSNFVRNAIVDIVDYSSTSKNKTVKTLSGMDRNGTGYIEMRSSLFPNTSAITSIRLRQYGADIVSYDYKNFAQNTIISLYGLRS